MKLTVNDLIFKGKWVEYCKIKNLDPNKVNSGEIDDQLEVTLTPAEIKALNLVPKTSICGDAGN